MIDLPADLVIGLRERLGLRGEAADATIPIEDMMDALGDRIPLSDLRLVLRQGEAHGVVVLLSDGRLDVARPQRRRLAA